VFEQSRRHSNGEKKGGRKVTNEQLYLAVGLPILFNLLSSAVLILFVNYRITDLHKRLDDLIDLWRAELRRVEEVMDARLKHLEENR
jgi:hypothetical protein